MSETMKRDISDFTLMKLVWENSSLAGAEKLVALGLARKYSQKNGYSKYSLRSLAKDTGYSVNGIKAIIPRIIATGEWTMKSAERSETKYFPVLDKLLTPQPKVESVRKKNFDVASNFKTKTDDVDTSDTRNTQTQKTSPSKKKTTAAKTTTDDAFLNSKLPLYRENEQMNKENIAPFYPLSTNKAYATRLHKITDINTRGKPADFTVQNLTGIYSRFQKAGFPLEAIDTLLMYQCENALGLSDGFLRGVLGRLTKNGKLIKPKTNKSRATDDKIYQTAKIVWDIIDGRNTDPNAENNDYVETL